MSIAHQVNMKRIVMGAVKFNWCKKDAKLLNITEYSKITNYDIGKTVFQKC